MGYAFTMVATMIATATVVRFIERVKFTALLYYIVEKEYTEPTKEEMERCIDIVSKETVDEWFRRRKEKRQQ